jgi:alpha-glucosidase (family GH31 glycosyl hydrolase)
MLVVALFLIGCTGDPKSTVEEEMSFDTANPYQTVFGCGDESLSEQSLDSSIDFGGFTIYFDDSVFHVVHGNRSVFDGTPDWLSVEFTDRIVEEYQGSFTIEHTALLTCSEPVVSTWFAGEGRASFDVEFTDEGCETTVVSVEVCLFSDNRFMMTGTLESEIEGQPRLVLSNVSDSSEKMFGLGEQFPHDTLNLKGRTIPVLSEEGGIGRGHPEVTPLINQFSNGSGGDENSTYFAMPFYMTDSSNGFFLHNTEIAEFEFQDVYTSVRVDSEQFTAEWIVEDTPLDVLTVFTEYTGRMPAPPNWIDNGAILGLARPLDEGQEYIDELLGYGVQISGIWNQTWSGVNRTFIGEQVLWNWVQGVYDHPNWNTWVEGLNDNNIEVLCYVNPMFLDVAGHESTPRRNLYQEGVEGGYFVRDESGNVLKLPVTAFEVALLDLTNPDARVWMRSVIKDEMIDNAGCKGWMVDFAEALPFEAALYDETPADVYHNQYPVDWMKLNRTAIREAGLTGEVLTYNRAGYTQTPRHALMVWEGDQLTTWGFYDGFQSAIRGLINGGLSGITLNHSDVGGYTSIMQLGDEYSREQQLFMRWAEMSAFTSLMRTHEGNQPTANVQVYSNNEVMEHFARMTTVYTSLSTYRRMLFDEAETLGYPVVRHMWLQYNDDPEVFEHELQFLLGSDVLVAPYVEPCLISTCTFQQAVYLPVDTWVHLWTGEQFEGGQTVSVDAPIGYPAVFYRLDSEAMSDILDTMRNNGLDVHP